MRLHTIHTHSSSYTPTCSLRAASLLDSSWSQRSSYSPLDPRFFIFCYYGHSVARLFGSVKLPFFGRNKARYNLHLGVDFGLYLTLPACMSLMMCETLSHILGRDGRRRLYTLSYITNEYIGRFESTGRTEAGGGAKRAPCAIRIQRSIILWRSFPPCDHAGSQEDSHTRYEINHTYKYRGIRISTGV